MDTAAGSVVFSQKLEDYYALYSRFLKAIEWMNNASNDDRRRHQARFNALERELDEIKLTHEESLLIAERMVQENKVPGIFLTAMKLFGGRMIVK